MQLDMLFLLLVQGAICAERIVVDCGCCGVEVTPIFAGTKQTALPTTFLDEPLEMTTI